LLRQLLAREGGDVIWLDGVGGLGDQFSHEFQGSERHDSKSYPFRECLLGAARWTGVEGKSCNRD
jgi:hypothetical protein